LAHDPIPPHVRLCLPPYHPELSTGDSGSFTQEMRISGALWLCRISLH
jgi:hypothetical protein